MPRRRDIEGGPKRDKELAEKTIKELTKDLAALGVPKGFFPKEIGGLGGTSHVTSCILCEELARGDVGFASAASSPPWVFVPALSTHNEVVLKKFAAPFYSDDPPGGCLAMTEPAGGCNIEDTSQHGYNIQTRAELKGNEWIINGQKMWPSGMGEAEVYCTVCTTDPKKEEEGITFIYVPKDVDGLSFGEPEEKMGMLYTHVCGAIYYDNVRVHKAYCCGKPGGERAKVLREIVTSRLLSHACGTLYKIVKRFYNLSEQACG